MTTIVPDLVTTNFNTLSFQRSDKNQDRRTIGKIIDERDIINNAKDVKKFKFNSKDKESFPYKYVLTGIQELNTFNRLYFSVENLNWVHSRIRYEVYEKSLDKTVISRQRDSDVLETMRRVYLQNCLNPQTKDEMKEEIIRLNKLVLDDVIPRILSEISQYKHYLRDIEKVRVPISVPQNTSITGTKLYERGPSDVLGLNVYN